MAMASRDTKPSNGVAKMIYQWKNGDALYRYQKSLVLVFGGSRRVLSTSVLQGGMQENLQAIFNHDGNPGAGMACRLEAETYEKHLALIAQRLGLDPQRVSGISTAASMDNVAIAERSYEDLTVTAVVTGGVEVNGGRVGDPSDWYEPRDRKIHKEGTINTFVVCNVDIHPGTMARALVTATEAKTAALQELMANSNYSTGIATGSGTDGTMIVADSTSHLRFENAGKHSKLGELIGQTVIEATKEALAKQSGFTPQSMHRMTKRLKRFGITALHLWDWYREMGGQWTQYEFMAHWEKWEERDACLIPTIAFLHLIDEWNWGLISREDMQAFLQMSDVPELAAAASSMEMVQGWCRKELQKLIQHNK